MTNADSTRRYPNNIFKLRLSGGGMGDEKEHPEKQGDEQDEGHRPLQRPGFIIGRRQKGNNVILDGIQHSACLSGPNERVAGW